MENRLFYFTFSLLFVKVSVLIFTMIFKVFSFIVTGYIHFFAFLT